MAESGRPGGARRRPAPGLAAAAALALACAARGGAGPEARLRLDGPDAVGWEPAGPYALRVELHNASGYALPVARPLPEALQVKVFRASDGTLACRTPSPTHRQYEGWDVVPIPAASGLPLEVDLGPYCRGLAPGVYRWEAVYVANPAQGGGAAAYTGTLGPRAGRAAVGEGLSRDRGALAAALSPPAGGAPDGGPALAAPPEPSTGAGAAQGADDARRCVDRELARRGLNAYGDPQGTRYAQGPPADEGGRVLFVAGRNAGIRRACGITGP